MEKYLLVFNRVFTHLPFLNSLLSKIAISLTKCLSGPQRGNFLVLHKGCLHGTMDSCCSVTSSCPHETMDSCCNIASGCPHGTKDSCCNVASGCPHVAMDSCCNLASGLQWACKILSN